MEDFRASRHEGSRAKGLLGFTDPKVHKVPKACRVIPKFHGEGTGRLMFLTTPH